MAGGAVEGSREEDCNSTSKRGSHKSIRSRTAQETRAYLHYGASGCAGKHVEVSREDLLIVNDSVFWHMLASEHCVSQVGFACILQLLREPGDLTCINPLEVFEKRRVHDTQKYLQLPRICLGWAGVMLNLI